LGRQAFNALFDSGLASDWMSEAKRAGAFQLQISADDPAVLAWPWEALNDRQQVLLNSVEGPARRKRRISS
jgi:hypothetical protein